MKKEVAGRLISALIISIFLLSNVIAVEEGTCGVVASSECDDPETEGYIVMGLSSSTNTHGEFPYSSYPYVLCCNFGDGDTTCRTLPDTPNKIIGLSSSTNAHAEQPELENYLIDVCYEDMECVGTTNDCGAIGTDAADYPLTIFSLSEETNAHIGGIDDYSIKICCGSVLSRQKTCTLESASWNLENAAEGQRVYLQVTGSGPECGGVTVSFEVWEEDVGGTNPVTTEPQNVAFSGDTATSIWYAEWQGDGLLGDPEYYFNASLVDNPGVSIISSNQLTVAQQDEDFCIDIVTCDDYDNELDCNSDTGLCNVAGSSGEGIVDCSIGDIVCGCFWDEETGCGFGYTEISTGEDCDPATDLSCCEPGETLCSDNVCRDDCTTFPVCVEDGTCSDGEGCNCADCDGEQDSCDSGSVCSEFFGACACNYGFTLCVDDSGISYCYLGDSCPGTDAPTDLPENQNGSCDFGIDGCLSPDCQDGDQDTCFLGTYCISKKCSSLEGPIITFGNCKITQVIEKECDEEPVGYKIVNWDGEWTGEQSGEAYEKCVAGGTRSIPCPTQIQLPFFEYTEMIITSAIIALIYISLILKKRLMKKGKRRRK